MLGRLVSSLAFSLVLTRTALAQPPASAEAPAPHEQLAGGFSLERGAWLATPRHEFAIGLLTTLRYGAAFTSTGADSLGFSLPFVRPSLRASMFDGKLRFLIQPELSGANVRLLDAQVIYQPFAEFGLNLGQYRPSVSRAWITPIPLLAMPGRGAVDDAFHTDRALGATIFGRPFDGKLEYDVGLFNAGGYNLDQPLRLEPLVTWRLGVNPLGPVPYTQTPAFDQVQGTVVGLAAHGWSDRFRPDPLAADSDPVEQRRVVVGGEFVLMTRNVHLLFEGFGRWALAKSSLVDAGWGAQLQFAVMLLPRTLELQARAGVLDSGIQQSTQGIWEGGLSWYLWGNHLRAQLHYSCVQEFAHPSGCASQRAQLQTQLWF